MTKPTTVLPRTAATRTLRLLASTAIVSAAAIAGGAHAQSLPQGGNVVAGAATIAQTSATKLDINQSSNLAVINWNSFNIAAGHQVNIAQPGASSMSIQQVIGASPSQIFGTLSSNGRVVVANPNGIYMGPGALIDVAGIVATTARVSTPAAQSLAASGGPLVFDVAGRADASVVNDGTITVADRGLAALVAPGVRNNGLIQARLGEVRLASANRATIDFWGDGLVSFAIAEQAATGARGPDGQALSAAVDNAGTIRAAGGRVLLTSSAAQNVVDAAINMSGLIDARSASVAQNGTVVLDGGAGTTLVSGTIDASGRDAGRSGGAVDVLGKRVGLLADSRIDAAGDAGGGSVRIGGDYLGQGTLAKADATIMAGSAAIDAGAVTNGNGGRVILWSEGYTSFQGAISVRGGAAGGNGGFVETSSKENLQVQTGRVDAAAPAGAGGTWLLDPRDVTITNATAGGVFDGGSPNSFTPSADNATVDVATINAALNADTNVTITTGTSGGQLGTIMVNASILKSAGSNASLSLVAASAININSSISSTSGSLGLLLSTSNGGVFFDAPVTLGGVGNLTVDSHGSVTQTAAISVGGATSINAHAGEILLNMSTNNFGQTVHLENTGLNNVDVRTSGRLTLGTVSVGTGTLGLRGGTGIEQAFGGSIVQAAGADTVTLQADSGVIALSNATNDFTGAVSAINDGAYDIAIRDLNAFTIGTIASSRNLTLTSNGNLNQGIGSEISVLGASSFSAGAGTLILSTATNTFGGAVSLSNSGANNVQIYSSDPLTLGTVSIGSGTFRAIVNGAITQTGAFRQSANAGIARFEATGGAITLTNANNDFVGALKIANTGPYDVKLVDSNGMSLDDVNVSQNLDVTVNGPFSSNIMNVGGIFTLHQLAPTATASAGGNAQIEDAANRSGRTSLTPQTPVSGDIFESSGRVDGVFVNPTLLSTSGPGPRAATFGQYATALLAGPFNDGGQTVDIAAIGRGESRMRAEALQSTALLNNFVNSGWLGPRGASRR